MSYGDRLRVADSDRGRSACDTKPTTPSDTIVQYSRITAHAPISLQIYQRAYEFCFEDICPLKAFWVGTGCDERKHREFTEIWGIPDSLSWDEIQETAT
jgi:hypothetical protein